MKGKSVVRLKIETRDFTCQGAVELPAPEGYRRRILDLLNEGSEFVALTDVLLYPSGDEDEDPLEYDTLLIRKGVIDLVVPYD